MTERFFDIAGAVCESAYIALHPAMLGVYIRQSMTIAQTIADCRAQRAKFGSLALVPTMGALHAGHLSLIELAKQHAPNVAVSIFVNPTQFGPKEDFLKYPRPIEEDLEKCRSAGADMVFNPGVEEMYPPPQTPNTPIADQVHIEVPALTGMLEGRIRPNHFKGVCQVVAKLFNIIEPQVACFGQKDYQQLRVLTAMVEGLNWPIKIVPGPTLRERDGLAMSSRNQYLSPEERQRALSISRGLFWAQDEFENGVRQTNRLMATVQNTLLDAGIHGRVPMLIDYVAAVDAITLKNVELVAAPTLLAVAARVGKTRLIDNLMLNP